MGEKFDKLPELEKEAVSWWAGKLYVKQLNKNGTRPSFAISNPDQFFENVRESLSGESADRKQIVKLYLKDTSEIKPLPDAGFRLLERIKAAGAGKITPTKG